ncbi:MAG: OmpA family protein [Geminicoccaceae bacterium]|nr:OmpA family protein [Geminicoccaceae bacterium]
MGLPVPRSTLVGSTIPVSRSAVAGIALSRTERGLALALPGDILFDFDRAELRASALPVLSELGALLRAERPKRVRIEGHTDSMGSEAYNLELGRRRAEAVRDHLVRRHGLEPGLFTVESFGESRPLAPNARPDGRDDPEGRQKNRRVEVVLE